MALKSGNTIEGKIAREVNTFARAHKKQIRPQGWQEWYSQTKLYLDNVGEILNAVGGETVNLRRKMQAEPNKVIGIIDMSINKLKNLNPPQELITFHNNIRNSLEHNKKQTLALLRGNNHQVIDHAKQALKSNIDAFTVLREVFIRHNAPEERIFEVDLIINVNKQGLTALEYR